MEAAICFAEAKTAVLKLLGEPSSTPDEYQSCVQNALASFSDWEKYERMLKEAAGETASIRFSVSHLTSDVNELLQSLHDVAEDRVIRGYTLGEAEVKLITDLTQLYSLLHTDIYPAFIADDGAGVIELSGDTESGALALPQPSRRVQIQDNERRRTLNHVMHPSDSNEDRKQSFDAMDAMLLTDDELESVRVCFLTRKNERLLKYGLVVKTRKLSRKLRYLFLTNYQLLYMQNAEVVKGNIDLANVTEVQFMRDTNFDVIARGRTYHFYSAEPQAWVEAIQKALRPVRSLLERVAPPPPEPRRDSGVSACDVVVFVGGMEELRDNVKKRPDHPYFHLGIGNPEYMHHAVIERFRSATRHNTRSPTFSDSFLLRLTSLHPLMLDLRVYSRVPSGNDFCYGIVNASLDALLTTSDHTVQGWWPLRTSTGDQGRVFLRLSLTNHEAFGKQPAALPVVPALVAHRKFELREKVPLVFGEEQEVIGAIHGVDPDSMLLVDTVSKVRLYTLMRTGFLKKEYTVHSDRGILAQCYHKMKTIRKKKLRMTLMSEELLFSMEGDFNNEVAVKNAIGKQVASVVMGKSTGTSRDGKVLLLTVLDAAVDTALLVVFCMYALRTL